MKKIIFALTALVLVSCSQKSQSNQMEDEILQALEGHNIEKLTLQDSTSNKLFAAQLEEALAADKKSYQDSYDSLHITLEAYGKLGSEKQALLAKMPKEQRQQLMGPLKEVLNNPNEPTKEELRELVENETVLRMALDSIAIKYKNELPIYCYQAEMKDGSTGYVFQDLNTRQIYIQAEDMNLQDLSNFAVQAAAAYAKVSQFYTEKSKIYSEHLNTAKQILQNLRELK